MARRSTNPPDLHPAPSFSHVAEVLGGRTVEIECTASVG